MQENPPDQSEEQSTNSSRNLVRILVILGIGIPVVVELLTLFNLVKVQIWEEEPRVEVPAKTSQAEPLQPGDTLFAEQPPMIVFHEMQISVNAQSWTFILSFKTERVGQSEVPVSIDSLRLHSGRFLRDTGSNGLTKQADSSSFETSYTWSLPSGDLPEVLFLTRLVRAGPDSTYRERQEILLGNIPVRYQR